MATKSKKADGFQVSAAAVERMKKLHAQEQQDARVMGRNTGRKWAEDTAAPGQLRRLAKAEEEHGGDQVGVYDNGSNEGAMKSLAEVIDGESATYREAVRFWNANGIDPDDLHDTEFAAGFVEGALEVWGQVEPQL